MDILTTAIAILASTGFGLFIVSALVLAKLIGANKLVFLAVAMTVMLVVIIMWLHEKIIQKRA